MFELEWRRTISEQNDFKCVVCELSGNWPVNGNVGIDIKDTANNDHLLPPMHVLSIHVPIHCFVCVCVCLGYACYWQCV